MHKILLFDFDGTIADSFDNFLEILKTLAIKYNFPLLPRHDLEKFRDEEPRILIKALQIPMYKIPLLARDLKRMQHEQILTIEPIKDLPEVLHTLKKKGVVLGILTSNGKANVEGFAKNHNLDIFDYISSDSSMFGKDKTIRKFLKDNMIMKENIIYVGDEIRDIQACRKVGIKIAAVTWGFNSKKGLIRHKPDFLIDKPSDLLKLIFT